MLLAQSGIAVAEFTEEAKLLAVRLIARFTSYPDAARHITEQLGIETDHYQLRHYDPENPHYRAGEKWVPIFEAERAKYLTDVTSVPIANQGYRLNGLQQAAEKALKTGQLALYASLLEQAAKEVGGVLTNERRVINDGKPSPRDMSADERREALAEIVRQAQEQAKGAQPPASTVQ